MVELAAVLLPEPAAFLCRGGESGFRLSVIVAPETPYLGFVFHYVFIYCREMFKRLSL
jgi:hypothetical protein